MCCEKHLKDNKHNSLHLAGKYAQIFVLGHYLFLEAHSLRSRTPVSLLGTDSVRGQISEAIVYSYHARHGKCMLDFWGRFSFYVTLVFYIIWGVYNQTIIPEDYIQLGTTRPDDLISNARS